MPLMGAPLAMNAIAGPEPSAISMLSAAIACCMRASPPKMVDSISRPFCANSPLRIPISSGTNEKATPTALPTRSVSAAHTGAAARAQSSSAAPKSATLLRSKANGVRPCGLMDHALSKRLGPLDRKVFAGATRVPDAVQHEALAEWCTAGPGPFETPESGTVPGLQRTTEGVLRRARDKQASANLARLALRSHP